MPSMQMLKQTFNAVLYINRTKKDNSNIQFDAQQKNNDSVQLQ